MVFQMISSGILDLAILARIAGTQRRDVAIGLQVFVPIRLVCTKLKRRSDVRMNYLSMWKLRFGAKQKKMQLKNDKTFIEKYQAIN